MTDLEKKLKKLGYVQLWGVPNNIYSKCDINEYIYANIELDNKHNSVKGSYISLSRDIETQEDIDNIQIAFNNLERDVKEQKNEATRYDTKRVR